MMFKLLEVARKFDNYLTKQSGKSDDRVMLEKLNFLLSRGDTTDMSFMDAFLEHFDYYMAGDPIGMEGIDSMLSELDLSLEPTPIQRRREERELERHMEKAPPPPEPIEEREPPPYSGTFFRGHGEEEPLPPAA